MKLIEDLHGNVFEVVDYNLLPLHVFNGRMVMIHEGEKWSYNRNLLEKGFNSIIVISYKNSYLVCTGTPYYYIIYKVKLIGYKKENDIRYGKHHKNT